MVERRSPKPKAAGSRPATPATLEGGRTVNKGQNMANLVEFFRETKREIAKVTWPSRRETVMTTVMIVGMALAAGVFFFFADSILSFVISSILGMRS